MGLNRSDQRQLPLFHFFHRKAFNKKHQKEMADTVYISSTHNISKKAPNRHKVSLQKQGKANHKK